MSGSDRKSISTLRLRLENPYAYIEHLETEEREPNAEVATLSASRRLLENPYAYLADGGRFEAETTRQPASGSTLPQRWTNETIAIEVRKLHGLLWRNREVLWPAGVPHDPIALLDPAIALEAVGYQVEWEDGLGLMPGSAGQIEVAGIIDTRAKVVRVGRQFSPSVRAFTTAHELGHAVLHPTMTGLHRDKPLDGSPMSTGRVEVEANKFATLFLMPERLVRATCAELFQVKEFELTDEFAFALAGCSLPEFSRRHPTRRHVSRTVAGAKQFNGRHFAPLHEQFRVSRETMAIRLEELALVR